jgi:hypothetical protein
MRKPLKKLLLDRIRRGVLGRLGRDNFLRNRLGLALAPPLLVRIDMRVIFLTWLMVALLLFGLGRLTHAGDRLEIAGFLTATDQEAIDGYFSLGGDAMVVVKQDSGLQRWLKGHAGQRVRVTLEPAGPEQ